MFTLLSVLILVVVCFGLILTIRSYETLRLKELKRQSRGGNVMAARVYKVRSEYGTELWLLMWLIIGLASASIVLLLDSLVWTWLAVLFSAIFLIISRLVLPHSKRIGTSLRLASLSAPVFEVALRYLHPLLKYPARGIEALTFNDVFATIHSREEMVETIKGNAEAAHISRPEAEIAVSALTFGDKQIFEVMTPLAVVKTVDEDTILSPVELGELHESGFSRFPVKNSAGEYVGTLFLKDAADLRSNKTVGSVMRKGVVYVGEHESLEQALKAFLKTHQHLFLAVNDFEELVGVVTIEDVIESIIGAQIVDEFDQYDDLRAVATKRAKEIRSDREATVVE
jgi:CBS domain containing-hemolysin-like protein